MKTNWVYSILVVLILASTDVLSFNYLSYISIILLFFLRTNSFSLKCRAYPIYAFLLIISFSLFKVFQLTPDSFRDMGLMLLGILCFLNKKPLIYPIKPINLILACCFIFCFITKGENYGFSMATLIASDMGFESPMFSFVFPFFFYYWLGKNTSMTLLNFLIVFLAGKRISILAVVFVCFYYISLKHSKISKITTSNMLYYFMNIAYILISYLFLSGYFDEVINELTGVSSNALTMGRQDLYADVFSPKLHNIKETLLFGIGVGNIVSYIGFGGDLLHNDVLRLLIENGILISILFFGLLYKGMDDRTKGFILIWNILFLTDNTLVYPQVIFAAFFLMINYSTQIYQGSKLTRIKH